VIGAAPTELGWLPLETASAGSGLIAAIGYIRIRTCKGPGKETTMSRTIRGIVPTVWRMAAIAIAVSVVAPTTALAQPMFSQWTPTQSMSQARFEGFAARLPNGGVLVGGGASTIASPLSETEIYNPSSGTWLGGPDMGTPRVGPSAVTLKSGSVLVVGGQSTVTAAGALDTGQIYNPSTNAWGAVSNTMSSARAANPAAVLLQNGEVLVAGGLDTSNKAVATADLYNPATNSFTPVASMHVKRSVPTATLLPNGNVLVAGGSDSVPIATAEVYNPTANTWTLVSNTMSAPRYAAGAVLLPTGKVLVAGGVTTLAPGQLTTATTDLYEPSTNAFTPGPAMPDSRALFGIASLPDGMVLVAGGAVFPPSPGSPAPDATSALYSPVTNSWASTGVLPTSAGVVGGTMTELLNGQVLFAGGATQATIPSGTTTAEVYTPTAVPGAPSSVSATPGFASALVTFAPPASDGGLTIDHYTIKASTGQTVTTPDARTSATVTGLKNGTAVTFTVTATNSLGTGIGSPASGSVIPGPPTLKFSGLKTKLKLKAFLKGFAFSITPNKASSLKVSLLGSTGRATISRTYNLTLASASFRLSTAKRAVKLKPSKKLVGNPKRAKVELVIVATDASGNSSTTVKTIAISR
jgi:N-acetylneuraminic acid mutarotase